MMRGELEEVKEEWIKNAESFTNEYLQHLSATDGNILSIEKLKEKYKENLNKQIARKTD